MFRFELTTHSTAPREALFDLSLDIDTHVASMAGTDERAVAGVTSGAIGLGESVTWRARHFGIVWNMTSTVTALDRPSRFVDEQTRGPFRSFRHEHLFIERGTGSTMIDRIEASAPLGPLGTLAERLALERHLRRLIAERNRVLVARAERPGA
ncbi:SRPBCC family protein [Agromyces atrinae]|uniref:SRPBCC family protein n=1 Tax=Agromyces atrinae TaxID=592376 RepID=UPI001F57E1DB|nr:SRPBCC family protein [Agromyces atrinae]MCI2956326.1 SRPBCC family protein [Agromyces atrinae]